MDREVLDRIEREIDQELRGRFPGSAVRQAVLLQYGDDPEIGPGDRWFRVLLDADGPEDNWEPALTAFEQANETAIEQFSGLSGSKAPGDHAGRVHVQQQPCHLRRQGTPGGHARRAAAVGHSASGSTARPPSCWRALVKAWPGDGGHADHGGNRGHPRGGHPVGPGPHPRAASVPAAPGTEMRRRQAQERVLRPGQITGTKLRPAQPR